MIDDRPRECETLLEFIERVIMRRPPSRKSRLISDPYSELFFMPSWVFAPYVPLKSLAVPL